MGQTEALSKILHVREKEKKDAQLAHHQSIEFFEKVANKLYDVLRKKEDAEDFYQINLQATISIDKMKDQITYIESLNKRIVAIEEDVKRARAKMETKQLLLTDAHVEVKKYEKIIQFRKDEQIIIAHKMEQISMDEISIQQYLSRKLGE